MNLDPGVAAQLSYLAKVMGTSQTQALNQATATTHAVYRAVGRNGELRAVGPGNTYRKIRTPRLSDDGNVVG